MDLSKSPLSKNVEDRRSPEGIEGDAWNALMMELLKGQPVPTEYKKGDRIKGDREPQAVPPIAFPTKVIRSGKGDKESAMPAMDPARAAMLAAIDPESFVENFIVPAGAGAPPPPAAATGGDEMAQGGSGYDPRDPRFMDYYGNPVNQLGLQNFPGGRGGVGTTSLNTRTFTPGGVREYFAPGSPGIFDAFGPGGGAPAQSPNAFDRVGQAAPPMDTAPLGQAPGPRGMGGGYGEVGPSNLPPRPGSPAAMPSAPQVPMPQGVQVPTDAPGVNYPVGPQPQPQTQTLDPSQAIAPQIKAALAAGRPAMPSGAPVPLPQPKPEVPGAPGTGVTAGNVASALTGVSDMLGDSKPPPSAGVNGPRPVDNGNALYELMARLGLNPGPGARPVSPYAGRR